MKNFTFLFSDAELAETKDSKLQYDDMKDTV